METLPWVYVGLSAFLGIIVWTFLLWLAWVLVTSVKGMRDELAGIRKALETRTDQP